MLRVVIFFVPKTYLWSRRAFLFLWWSWTNLADCSTRVERCRLYFRSGSKYTSLKSPFNSCRTLYFFQLLHWKALCFKARWEWKKIYNFRFINQATDSCVQFVQTIDSCIWIWIVTDLLYFSVRCYDFSD